VDNQDPYNVYGGLQDNGTWVGPSNSLLARGIMKRHWKGLAGGDGYYAVPIPGSEHEVYANLQGGVIFHVDTRTGNVRTIHPYPKITGSAGDAIEDHKYRFNWDSPIHISPHDPNTVFFGGNVLFKSSDRGYNWEEISGDLTTNDKSKQRSSGGDIYQDNTAAEFHCTILTIAESPVTPGVIWVGTDDGNIQVTRDGGKTWANVNKNVPGLPAFSWVGKIHASEHDAGTAFVAVDQHRLDDFTPHAYMTTDYGKTWKKIVNGLPKDDYVKVIRQDPHHANVLYIGMEHGIYMSWDKGANWSRINSNLPPVSVRDLRVQARENDLVVGTHGRGAWILDDISPLQNLDKATAKKVELFDLRRATRWHMYSQLENLGDRTYVAPNPEYGAYINFFLQEAPKEAVKVEILSADGVLIREMTSKASTTGLNRIVWDLRMQEGVELANNSGGGGWWGGAMRAMAPPGTYTVVLHANGEKLSKTLELRADPRLGLSPDDYQKQSKALIALQSLLSQTNQLINESELVMDQLEILKKTLMAENDPANKEALAAVDKAMKAVETLQDEWQRPPPSMNYRQKPRLRDEIRSRMREIDSAAAPPTASQEERVVSLKEETEAASKAFDEVIRNEIMTVNTLIQNKPKVAIKRNKP
jgi:hypothetical protein